MLRWLYRSLEFLVWFVIADVVLSWLQAPGDLPYAWTRILSQPLYAPVRGVLSLAQVGGLEFAPLVVVLAAQGLQYLIKREDPSVAR